MRSRRCGRIAACGGIVATPEVHVKQFPQRPLAMGLPAFPNRPPTALTAGGHMTARSSPASPCSPHPLPASAMPSTLHGTQTTHSPVPSAMAAPPTFEDAATAGNSAAVRPGVTSAAATPVVVHPPATPDATAAPQSGGATGTTRYDTVGTPRSQVGPQRGDLLLYLPRRPVVVDVCVTYPLASSVIVTAA